MPIKAYLPLLAASAVLSFSACSSSEITETTSAAKAVVAEVVLSPLEAVLASETRGENAARDTSRNPKETLEFLGLAPNMTIVEVWPGGGWYADILVPYSLQNGGTYIAAGFPETSERGINGNKQFIEKYTQGIEPGKVSLAEFGDKSGPIAAGGSVDLVLSFRNVHNWMGAGFAEKAFEDFYAALKPGGTLGVVEHRLPATQQQDPSAPTGYVQEAYTKMLAAEAGFEFVGSSEINANPKDTADHPFGVWTLPPRNSRESRDGTESIEDGSKYEAIGESDRMTLKFRKPL